MEEDHYNVELYHLTHRGNPGDVRFYQKVCRGASSVLELGCGTGRVLLPLAKQGLSVTGLDAHPGMIHNLQRQLHEMEELPSHQVKLVVDDMRTFELDTTFERIILPFNGLFCLLSDEDVLSCFRSIHQHLAPGGSFVFDVYVVDEEELTLIDPNKWDHLTTLYEERRTIEIFERRDWQAETQRVDASYRYRIHEGTEVREEEYCIPQRYVSYSRLRHLLHQAGLQVTECFEDFQGNLFEEDSYHLIVWTKGVRT
jgi:SAM-dependent methyltransferase